ncbi:cupin domain-containing protein [Bdellovibrio reynosensis]|uniref:Cupin domain-containing protein n=1 Tax=Bdellovibrio reynosensis TaxID=2835041 RepID=A0ABY4CC55_9BACT|nr:cupin domain-containing protein [Bdellovibrio reynosensis]UOF02558.1 cupin domain-containing protein [Bdellovibrio reynosensis]
MKSSKTSVSPLKPVLLDQKFWKNFAANYWEKKPLALKNVKSGLLEMSAAEIFDLLVLYSDRCRKLNDPEGFKFYIDGFKADADDVLQVLPVKSDKSLLGYHARMEAEFSDYCLVCDELLKVNLKKQHLLTDFTDELYHHVGFPNRFSEMGLYLGNYRKTPFGVHVDSCGVFSFPVAGTKTFRLWTPEFAEKHPDLDRAFKYDKYKKDSLVLEARPGDMTYWPSNAWHIAESDGSFSATWSLGVWVDQPHKNMFSDSLKDLLDSKLAKDALKPTTSFKTLHNKSGEVTELPSAYRDSMAVLQNLSALQLQEAFLKSWMKHISLQGFKTIPKVDLKITPKLNIKLRNNRALILWQQSLTDKKVFYFSFGGVLVESKSRGLLKLVTALNAGKTCLVGQFLKGLTAKKDLALLQKLVDAGSCS